MGDCPSKEVTLSELRYLDWTDCDGSISLIPRLIAPKLSVLEVELAHGLCFHAEPATLSSILSSDGHRIPLLLEPIEARYVCKPDEQSFTFFYKSTAYLKVTESWRFCQNSIVGHWFLIHSTRPSEQIGFQPRFPQHLPIPVSFSKIKKLTVEGAGLDGSQTDAFPIGMFEKLKEHCLRREVDRLIVRYGGRVPCPKLSRVDAVPYPLRDKRSVLTNMTKILKGRLKEDRKVETVQIPGSYTLFSGIEVDLKELRDVVGGVIHTSCWGLR